MYTFRRIAGLLSFAVLAILLLSIGTAATVQAHNEEKIKTKFDMNAPSLPGDVVLDKGSSGSGVIKIDGDSLDFDLKIKGEGLTPNTEYQISIQIRSELGAPVKPADVIIVAGSAWTNHHGRLNARGGGTIDLGELSGSEWRIDQQILRIGSGAGSEACEDCILVCAPTTKVMLNETGDGLVVLSTP